MKNERRDSDSPGVPSSERVSLPRDVPAEWLDRLLVVGAAVRPATPLAESTEHLLAVARDLLEDVAVGACIPGPPEQGGQLVVRLSPRSSHVGEPDPARLFPEFAYEVTIPVEDGTLHAATDDEGRLDGNGPARTLLGRLAQVLASVVHDSRTFERARAQADRMQELQAQVIQSEKLASLGQIAAGIVHELNNPLTTIVAYSDFLRKKLERGGGDPADIKRLVHINDAAERILRFSRDLIAYSRPSSEVPAPVAIHEVIDRALGFCEHELDKTGVMVEKSFGAVRHVRGIAGQLTQVFVNLFTNAAHAMRDGGGLLRISTGMADERVEITITDDGHGIEPDTLPRIFDPFFTTKTDGTGTGLGLSIVRNIVVGHGGTIRASRHAPKGTAFYVVLPIAAPGDA